MKKVIHICNGYLDTKLYSELINRLESRDIINYIYIFCNKNKNILYKNLGKNIIIDKSFNYVERIIYWYKQRKIFKRFYEKFKNEEIDLIHAHTVFSNGDIAYRIKKKNKIPYVVAVRNTDINLFFKYIFFLRRHGINILKNADKVIFLSSAYKEEFFKRYVKKELREELEKKIHILPNGIDDFWLKNKNLNKKNLGKKIRLIQVGDINKNKNIVTTIKVCKELIKKGFDIELKIIGRLYLSPKVLEENFIKYISFCRKEELLRYYRESDIFILPSKYETFGLVYAEALSQGLPIIYTRGQGFDRQIPDGEVGYSIIYNDVDEIVKKIEKIIKNYEYYSSNIERYLEKFSWGKISEEYIKIYNELGKVKK